MNRYEFATKSGVFHTQDQCECRLRDLSWAGAHLFRWTWTELHASDPFVPQYSKRHSFTPKSLDLHDDQQTQLTKPCRAHQAHVFE